MPITRFLPALFILMLAGGPDSRAGAFPGVDIGNFGRVNQNYYRGSQPKAGEFEQLKRLGVKSVIDLQKHGKSREEEWVRAAGMQFFRIPLSTHHPATSSQTERFLALVNDPKNWPVYVHCAGGRHRTGAMTAIYRLTHDDWTPEQAYREMVHYEYYSAGGHGPLRDYVFDYYRHLGERSARPDAVSAPQH